jgi:hypothetical protein
MEHELEEQIADLIGRRYWEQGIGKDDEWCRKLARDILNLITECSDNFDKTGNAAYYGRKIDKLIEMERLLNAECSDVQMNSTQGHTRDKTAPDAQQNEQDDTKSP